MTETYRKALFIERQKAFNLMMVREEVRKAKERKGRRSKKVKCVEERRYKTTDYLRMLQNGERKSERRMRLKAFRKGFKRNHHLKIEKDIDIK